MSLTEKQLEKLKAFLNMMNVGDVVTCANNSMVGEFVYFVMLNKPKELGDFVFELGFMTQPTTGVVFPIDKHHYFTLCEPGFLYTLNGNRHEVLTDYFLKIALKDNPS